MLRIVINSSVLLILGSYSTLAPVVGPLPGDLNDQGFVDDYRTYKSINKTWHAGHPYAHAKWTANIIAHWFDTEHYWVHGLTVKDVRLAALAGFMHDVGKAGDTATQFVWKVDHPRDGFDYLLGRKQYQTAEGTDFNFSAYFRQLGITQQEQKIIAIVTGIHYDFGVIVLSGLAKGKPAEHLSELYIKKLEKLCKQADYNNGIVDRRLLMLAMLVSVADIKANTPFYYPSKVLGTLPEAEAAYDGSIVNKYVKFKVEHVGQRARYMILNYFDTKYTRSNTIVDVDRIIERLSHNRVLRRKYLKLRRKLYA